MELIKGRTLGPYAIGMPAAVMLKLQNFPIPGSREDFPPRCKMCGHSLCEFSDLQRGIDVYLSVRLGVIHMLIAREQFGGATSSGICVGMTGAEALIREGNLYFNDLVGVLESKNEPGLHYELEHSDLDVEQVPSAKITGLTIVDPQSLRLLESDSTSYQQLEEARARLLQNWMDMAGE